MSTTCKSLPTVTLIYRSKLSNNNNLTFLLWLTHYSAVELAKDAHIHLVQSTEVNTSKFLANIEEMFLSNVNEIIFAVCKRVILCCMKLAKMLKI